MTPKSFSVMKELFFTGGSGSVPSQMLHALGIWMTKGAWVHDLESKGRNLGNNIQVGADTLFCVCAVLTRLGSWFIPRASTSYIDMNNKL